MQREEKLSFSSQELDRASLQKRDQRLMRWGVNDTVLVAGLVIKFVDDDRVLVAMLRGCQDFAEMLADEVWKQCLLATPALDVPVPHAKRKALWTAILRLKDYKVDYQEVVQLMNGPGEHVHPDTEKLIWIDVHRSFINMKFKEDGSNSLQNMLKAFAYLSRELEYC